MKIKFSKHALERMDQRGINKQQVETVIDEPDSIIKLENRSIYQAVLESERNNLYLYRVFVNTVKEPNLVVTVYKTSKIEKYL